MKILFYTSYAALESPLFRYIFARVAQRFSHVSIVAVRRPKPSPGLKSALKRLGARIRREIRRARLIGLGEMMGIIASLGLKRTFQAREQSEIDKGIDALSRPNRVPCKGEIQYVTSVNGKASVEVIAGLQPDVIIQAGAGILQPQIYSLSKLVTLNMHHGLAPAIRGMNSIQWALAEGRPDWIGATIHVIDAGIDTGDVLAYAAIKEQRPGECSSSLFVRTTEQGVTQLLSVLTRIKNGDNWSIEKVDGNNYRSTIAGWRLWLSDRRRKMRANADLFLVDIEK